MLNLHWLNVNLYFQNTTSGEEQVLVTGGYSYDEATQTRIYRGFYMKIWQKTLFFLKIWKNHKCFLGSLHICVEGRFILVRQKEKVNCLLYNIAMWQLISTKHKCD